MGNPFQVYVWKICPAPASQLAPYHCRLTSKKITEHGPACCAWPSSFRTRRISFKACPCQTKHACPVLQGYGFICHGWTWTGCSKEQIPKVSTTVSKEPSWQSCSCRTGTGRGLRTQCKTFNACIILTRKRTSQRSLKSIWCVLVSFSRSGIGCHIRDSRQNDLTSFVTNYLLGISVDL